MIQRFKDWLFSKSDIEIQAMWVLFLTTTAVVAAGFGYLIGFWPIGETFAGMPTWLLSCVWLLGLYASINALLFMVGVGLAILILIFGFDSMMDWLDKVFP